MIARRSWLLLCPLWAVAVQLAVAGDDKPPAAPLPAGSTPLQDLIDEYELYAEGYSMGAYSEDDGSRKPGTSYDDGYLLPPTAADRALAECAGKPNGTPLNGTQACEFRIAGADSIASLLPGGVDGLYRPVACHDGRPMYVRQGSPPTEERVLWWSNKFSDWDLGNGTQPPQEDVLMYGGDTHDVRPQHVLRWMIATEFKADNTNPDDYMPINITVTCTSTGAQAAGAQQQQQPQQKANGSEGSKQDSQQGSAEEGNKQESKQASAEGSSKQGSKQGSAEEGSKQESKPKEGEGAQAEKAGAEQGAASQEAGEEAPRPPSDDTAAAEPAETAPATTAGGEGGDSSGGDGESGGGSGSGAGGEAATAAAAGSGGRAEGGAEAEGGSSGGEEDPDLGWGGESEEEDEDEGEGGEEGGALQWSEGLTAEQAREAKAQELKGPLLTNAEMDQQYSLVWRRAKLSQQQASTNALLGGGFLLAATIVAIGVPMVFVRRRRAKHAAGSAEEPAYVGLAQGIRGRRKAREQPQLPG